MASPKSRATLKRKNKKDKRKAVTKVSLQWPPKVSIFEVGPRDGLQSEKQQWEKTERVELIEKLMKAGLS